MKKNVVLDVYCIMEILYIYFKFHHSRYGIEVNVLTPSYILIPYHDVMITQTGSFSMLNTGQIFIQDYGDIDDNFILYTM